jgi:hypothetical protein
MVTMVEIIADSIVTIVSQ